MLFKSKNKGFSLVELIVVIAILVVFAAILIPSLLQYTENSRAQKDVSAMDEVVNAFQLAMADQDCYDEAIKYSCTNNYLTYSDSSGNYGQVIADGEFWAPDGSGRATTITFNPEYGPNNQIIYDLSKGIVNDMTYGNGSVAQDRVMEGALIADNQCYFNKLVKTYNMVRQTVGTDVVTTSATYRNSSYTIFIRFNQNDNVTIANVDGSFNGTNLYEGAVASKGSGTSEYDNDGDAITSVTTPGTTESNYTSSDLQGAGLLGGGTDYQKDNLNPIGGSTPSNGEVYQRGDYEYKYGYKWNSSSWAQVKGQDGWGVRVLDTTKSSYGPILESINGSPIVNMDYTFKNCKQMTTSPRIPATVNSLTQTFYSCESLVHPPILPNGVKSLTYTFALCKSMISAPQIPNGVQSLNYTFYCCKQLIESPIIPDGVTSMRYTFQWCDNFEKASEIPSSVQDMTGTFKWCPKLEAAPAIPDGITSLTETFSGAHIDKAPDIPNSVKTLINTFSSCDFTVAPIIPSGVTNMENTFNGCKMLIEAPAIPSGVKNLQGTFYWCESMKTYVNSKDEDGDFSGYQLPSNIVSLQLTFGKCDKMVIPPVIPDTVTSMYETFWNSIALEQAPIIPSKVTTLYGTFQGCKSLLNAPTYIPETVTNMTNTFSGCALLTEVPELPSKLKYASGLFAGCKLISEFPAIPSTVIEMNSTFNGCTALTVTPVIPSGVTSMRWTFAYCTSLTTSPTIPDGVTTLEGAFFGCSALQSAPKLPSAVKSLRETFKNCTKLTTAPTIPNGAEDLYSMFSGCTSLTKGADMPSTATCMSFMYLNCSKLTGHININCPRPIQQYYASCFSGTTLPITITGTGTNDDLLQLLVSTSSRGNVTIVP